MKRRSAARSSRRSPRPRNRASGRAGSARPAITRWISGAGAPAGRPSRPGRRARRSRGSRRAPARHRRDGAEVVEQRGEYRSIGGGATAERRARPRRPRALPLQRGDQVVQNSAGSLSRWSSESQAADRARPARPPATPSTASSCRTRREPTPASAPIPPAGRGARSALDARPDRAAAWGREAGLEQWASHHHPPREPLVNTRFHRTRTLPPGWAYAPRGWGRPEPHERQNGTAPIGPRGDRDGGPRRYQADDTVGWGQRGSTASPRQRVPNTCRQSQHQPRVDQPPANTARALPQRPPADPRPKVTR